MPVHPVLVGGGTASFPRAERRADLELVGSHPFRSGVAPLRNRVRHGEPPPPSAEVTGRA